MSAPDNPPAYPAQTGPNGEGFQSGALLWTHPGMTLWDHFAGQAMVGLLRIENEQQPGESTYAGAAELLANDAAAFADAMLAERERRGIGK